MKYLVNVEIIIEIEDEDPQLATINAAAMVTFDLRGTARVTQFASDARELRDEPQEDDDPKEPLQR